MIDVRSIFDFRRQKKSLINSAWGGFLASLVVMVTLMSIVHQTSSKEIGGKVTWQQQSGGIAFARRSFLDLPPSAKLLYVLLKNKRRMSRQAIIEESFLPPRTVNYGLSRLKDLGLVTDEEHANDGRKVVYELLAAPM
ncbi:MAG: hypothetical protein ACOC38_10990 [Promethearchaeia archaeon]